MNNEPYRATASSEAAWQALAAGLPVAPAPLSSFSPPVVANVPSKRFLGILTWKERWGLSWRGWLIVGLIGIFAFALLLRGVHPFLAVTRRVDARLLVVEGWIHEFAIRASAEEFKAGGYERVFTTGGPVTGSGAYTSDADTSASVGAGRLRAVGIPSDSVQMVPARVTSRDRTYRSAVALREWLHERNMTVRSINIVTEDAHARRTRLLFQKAFGSGVAVGIIAVPNPDYDGKHWWRYSEGVREVAGEVIAYIYARVFFHPSELLNANRGAAD